MRGSIPTCFFQAFFAFATFLSVSLPGMAQSSATPAIKMVIPFPAGGSADSFGRIVGQALAQQLDQPVVVDNKPGADGAIGAEAVINSPANGLTIFLATNSAIVAVPTLRLKSPYDPRTAFSPIGMVGQSAFFLFVHPSVPGTTLQDFLAYAKGNPGKLNYATAGATSILASAQMLQIAGLTMTQVPYKGEALAVPDLVSGRVQVMLGSTTSLLSLVKEGKLKVLAVVGDQRSALAPDVPTLHESGIRGVSVVPWSAVFAPAGTPSPVVDRLSKALTSALRNPDTVRQLGAQGISAEVMTPAALSTFVAKQYEVWSRLVIDVKLERQ